MAAKYVFSQPFVLVGALIERQGKFLLLQENHGHDKGLWNIPSGKLDLGEPPIDCVKREVKEEAGLDFRPESIVLIGSNFREGMHTHSLRIIYTGEVQGSINFDGNEYDEVGDREINTYRWVDAKQMSQLPLRHPDISVAVERFLSGMRLPLDAIQHFNYQRPSVD